MSTLVEIATQPWGSAWRLVRAGGPFAPNVSARLELTDLDENPATIYAANDPEGATLSGAQLDAGPSGVWPGWVEVGTYLLTEPVDETVRQVEAITGQDSARLTAVESAHDPDGDPPSAVLRTEAPFVTGRMRLRDKWSAGDFGAKFAGDDETAILQDAIHETRAVSRVLWLPEGVAGVSDALTDTADNGVPLVIRGADKRATTLEYDNPAVESMISTLGSVEAVTFLTAPYTRGGVVLTVDDTTGLAPGDLLMIRDKTQPINGNPSPLQVSVVGNMRKIRSVDSATQITLYSPLSYDMASGADSDIRRVNTVKRCSVTDLTVVNPAPGTQPVQTMLNFIYTEKIDVARVAFRDMDGSGVRFQTCWDWRASDLSFDEFRDYETLNTPYCLIATNGTAWGAFTDSTMHYGRHMFTTGQGSSDEEIPASDIMVADCIGSGQAQSTFDCHPGSARIHFVNCHSYGGDDEGYQIRGPDCTITNPVVDAATIGIFAVNGADNLRIRGGGSSNCGQGILVQNSNGVRVTDHEIDRPITQGFVVVEDPAWANHIQKLRLRNVEVQGNPSGAAFDFSDVWRDGFELDGCKAPDATTKITGADTTPKLTGLCHDAYDGAIAPTPMLSQSTVALTANVARLSRFVPKRNMTVDTIAFVVTTAAGSDDQVDVGIYAAPDASPARLVSTGAAAGLVNSTGRKTVAITATKLVAGAIYYIAISCGTIGSTAASLLAAGWGSTAADELMGTGAPDLPGGSKTSSHPLPSGISGPSSVITTPIFGVLE